MYSHQETLDMVCKGLRLQNQTYTPEPSYRSHNGNKCIIGVLIPDSEYGEHLENSYVDDDFLLSLRCIENHDMDFLVKLQDLHDVSTSYKKLNSELAAFAKTYNLYYTSILR